MPSPRAYTWTRCLSENSGTGSLRSILSLAKGHTPQHLHLRQGVAQVQVPSGVPMLA